MKWTIGADPELFLVDAHGKFISAIGLIGGNKVKPLPLIREGCALQEDNVAVEFNIPPCTSKKAFVQNLTYVLDEIKTRVKALDLNIKIVPSAIFENDQLQDPAAQRFGCEPDYNAWTRKQNPRPHTKNKNLRSSGAHIHVGYDVAQVNRIYMARAFDVFVGSWLSSFDSDQQRRSLYGRAGAFRPKPYGIEYRVPSNIWITSKTLMENTYDQCHRAVDYMMKHPNESFTKDRALILKAVNSGNQDAFEQLTQRFPILV
jgi:hypothetical protein